MSKIGRKAIDTGSVSISLQGNEVHYKGKKASGVYNIPALLKVELQDKKLSLMPVSKTPEVNKIWGMHRALLANVIKGADIGFEKQLRIVGLGFKALVQGNKIQLTLGKSHKIDVDLPNDVTAETDKTGQLLTLRSSHRENLGEVAAKIRMQRPPEPYKGTGIQYVGEKIIRKAGKAKSA